MALLTRLFHWSGLASVRATGPDAYLVILSRASRMFAHGASSLLLALFFAELQISDAHIGLFMTLTLAGDVILALGSALVADRIGRRRTLTFGSLLMVLSGSTFLLSENFWVLLLGAVIGVISATGSDFGPFRAIEESVISELTGPDTRAEVLSWYVTTATLGSSVGTNAVGRMVEMLKEREGWTLLRAYHACFGVYVVMGVFNVVTSLLLSSKCELRKPVEGKATNEIGDIEETQGLVGTGENENEGDNTIPLSPTEARTPMPGTTTTEKKSSIWSSFATISRETRSIMLVLWSLLMVDSLADGMVSMALTSYYIDQKFHPSKSALGNYVSAAYFLCAATSILAGPLSRRIGLVNSMVFTHIPSSTAVLLFPVPNGIGMTVALLLLRMGLNNMDQAPRSALIAAVVKPEERTAVMGITSMLRTLASMTGPSVTGVLAGSDRFWIAFVVAGSLRLAYDLGLFGLFTNVKLYRHEPDVGQGSGERERSERQALHDEEDGEVSARREQRGEERQ